MASEERDALIFSGPDVELDVAGPPEPALPSNIRPLQGTAPTQRLLTALGRLQREIARAKEGAPQDQWSDECMNQLIGAVEIGLTQGWHEVVEALTETGRILQTYEEARRAAQCVDFLDSSCEILCLMAGDLIVGGVRPGVLNKWRGLHQRALEDVQAAGLTLIADDEPPAPPSARPSAAGRPAPPHDDAPSPFAMPREDESGAPSPLDDLPSLDELAPFEDSPSATETQADAEENAPPAAEDFVPNPIEATLDQFCGLLADIEGSPHSDHGAHFAQTDQALEALQAEAEAEARQGSLVLSETMRRLVAAARSLPVAPDDKFYELAYAFSGLYVEEATDPFAASVNTWVTECEALLRSWSAFDVTKNSQAVSTPPQGEATLFDLAEAAGMPSEMETPIFDLDAELEAETPQQQDLLVSETEQPEMIDPIEPVEARAPEAEAPAQAPPQAATPTPGTPEHFLWIAQRAVSEGRTTNAKALALQAVASIAKTEADLAEKSLQETETRLQAEADAIKRSLAEAQGAEDGVTKAEQRIAEARETFSRQQESTTQAQKQLGEIQVRLGSIEEQLRELQEKRDEMGAMLERAREELGNARQREKDREEEVIRLRAEEENARRALEGLRQTVKSHQRKRSEIESEMEQARDLLKNKREAFTDLQETIAHLGVSAPDPNVDPEDWLF